MKNNIQEHTFFDEYFNENLVIIDLGACKGEFTTKMEDVYKLKKAILVEASFKNFSEIPKKDNYVLYNRVISNNQNQLVEFYEDSNSPYNGSTIFNYFDGVKHEVLTITLDEIIKENDITEIDLLKIDIEGSEYELLNNIQDETYSKINQITVEFHDFLNEDLIPKTKEIIEKLSKLGYSYEVSSAEWANFVAPHYDVIFYRKQLK
jgi:FkbM family methyltransferase